MTTGQQQLLKALDADDKNIGSYAEYLKSIRSGYHFVRKEILNGLADNLGGVESLNLAAQFNVPRDHSRFEDVQFLRSFLDNQDWFYTEVNDRFVAYQSGRYQEFFNQVEP